MKLIIFGYIFCAMPAPCAELTAHTTTIESRRPVYWANVRDDGSVASATMQPTVLPLDMNSGNSIKGETGDFKPVTYLFSKGTLNRRSLSHIDTIYTVARTRRVPIVSSGGDWVIAEHFEANSHIPKCRYEMLGKTVRTQYILDPRGHVVRIADIGWRTDVADPRRSGDIRATANRHATWIRVFDVTGKGDLSLVATAWLADARERDPDAPPPTQNELRFSDQKEKQTWPDQRHFEAALRLQLSTQELGPSRSCLD